MNISVLGSRVSSLDWEAVCNLPREQVLAALTPEQRETARQLHVPEEDYARGRVADRKGAEKLLIKTERFARLLHKKARALKPQVEIENVTLDTWSDRFEVEMKINGRQVPLRVAEKLVDALFESGSPQAEQRLQRVLELAIGDIE